jgi:hypothetical protein
MLCVSCRVVYVCGVLCVGRVVLGVSDVLGVLLVGRVAMCCWWWMCSVLCSACCVVCCVVCCALGWVSWVCCWVCCVGTVLLRRVARLGQVEEGGRFVERVGFCFVRGDIEGMGGRV